MQLTHVPLIVTDQDRALEFYTAKVGFEKRADHRGPEGARWLTVAPRGSDIEFALISAKQLTRVPAAQDQKAGTAGLQVALSTTDCIADHEAMKARGVRFDVPGHEKPQRAPWGTSAYFRDPDGNAWAIVQQSWLGKLMVKAFTPKRT
ncbi:MAG TPA: VOC family protein [Candidatus Thermoplasmatota archaeon]|nr:VOC family protein [Candidatus Thermoplasmatota archaeon]